mmetsp:Transcript_27880/g.68939  ORF Transcript_27880/g.68939 Transcript_27880/m.68939 type:complete len:143 (-) Transcript_27880:1043-1471(-)
MKEQRKKIFKKFKYKGLELDSLLKISAKDLVKLLKSRGRRKFSRGLRQKPITLIRKLRKAKKETLLGEKTQKVKTHLRNMIIVPEMIGNQLEVYNGVLFTNFEIKPEMVGHYFGEFSLTYKPVKHGRPGVGASSSSRFVPLK